MGIGVPVSTFGEVSVKGVDNCIHLHLSAVVPKPLTDTGAAGIGKYLTARLPENIKETFLFSNSSYLFRTREIDILPVTLNGFYDLKPKNRFYIDFGSRLEVIVHKPISREELLGLSDKEIIHKVRNVIESAHKPIKSK